MTTLREKVYGCLAASRIGSAMGAAVEGWSVEKIRERHRFLDRLVAYWHYDNGWTREPGTTEDGIERQKLLVAAIVAKRGRITVEDFGRTAAEVTDLERMRYMTEPDDQRLIAYLKAGVPASEVGRLTHWSGLISVVRASHPIGLINAGDPEAAARDVRDVGRFCFSPTDPAHDWAAIYAGGVAEACRREATAASVVETARRLATDRVRNEVDAALAVAREHADYEPFRDAFYRRYSGRGGSYPFSGASEIVCKAFAVLVRTEGDPRRAILDAVNFGRDTDCLAACAGGLAGALSGVDPLPREWIDQVDAATAANPYTNRQTTIRSDAEALLDALRHRAEGMRDLIALIAGDPS